MMTASHFQGIRGLTVYLQAMDAGPAERKELSYLVPRTLGHPVLNKKEDGYDIVSARELLVSEGVYGSDLIQTEFYNTVLQGAEPAKCMRDFLPVVPLTKGKTLKLPKISGGSYAEEVAELADIPASSGKYDSTDVTVKKIGATPRISKEMVDDSDYGLIALEVQRAGARCENKFNRDALLMLLTGVTLEQDCAGSNLGLKAIATARKKVKKANRVPTKVVITPDMEELVADSLLPASTSPGYQNYMNTGQIGKILGMDVYSCTVSTGNSSYVWDYDAADEYGAIVIDALECGAIVMRQDITVENFENPQKQLKSATVTMRYGSGIMDSTAGCRVKY